MYPKGRESIEKGVGSWKRRKGREAVEKLFPRPEVGVETRKGWLFAKATIHIDVWVVFVRQSLIQELDCKRRILKNGKSLPPSFIIPLLLLSAYFKNERETRVSWSRVHRHTPHSGRFVSHSLFCLQMQSKDSKTNDIYTVPTPENISKQRASLFLNPWKLTAVVTHPRQ